MFSMMTDLGDYRNSKIAKENGTRGCEEVCCGDEFGFDVEVVPYDFKFFPSRNWKFRFGIIHC